MQEEGAIEYAEEKARIVMKRAWQQLEPKLKDCDAKENIHDLSMFLINRRFWTKIAICTIDGWIDSFT